MNNISELIDAMCDSDLKKSDVEAYLNFIELKSLTKNFGDVLFIFKELSPQFINFKSLFPNLIPILSVFDISSKVYLNFQNVPVSNQFVERHESQSLLKYIDGLQSEDIENEYWAEKVAIFWLIAVLSKKSPELFALDKKANFKSIFIKILSEIFSTTRNIENLSSTPLLNQTNFSDWFEEFLTRIDLPELKDYEKNFKEYLKLLKVFKPSVEHKNYLNENFSVLENQTRKVLDVGNGLSERQKNTLHIDSLAEKEFLILRKLFNRSIIDNPNSNDSKFFECLLVCLSLCTGRTPAGVLKFKLFYSKNLTTTFSKECFFVRYEIREYRVYWNVEIREGIFTQIRLPELARIGILKFGSPTLFKGQMVYDLLPPSQKPWPDKTLSWLSTQLPNVDQIKIRNTLARHLYKYSVNPAILTSLTVNDNQFRNTDSLSYYLNPKSSVFKEYYQYAATDIFTKKTPEIETGSAYEYSDIFKDHRLISSFFLDEIEKASASNLDWQRHNAIAHYLLMQLVIVTGHRTSSSPFNFLWDINSEENLVFICDKAITGSEARHVPIPSSLSAQLRSYIKYLLTFSESLVSKLPELALQIKNLAVGMDSPNLSLFFILNSKFKPHTITTQMLERVIAKIKTKTIRVFRSEIATFLIEAGLSGMQVEAFLGHNEAMHSFGASSSWSIVNWANQIRPFQEKYLKLGGWSDIPFPSNFSKPNDKLTVNVHNRAPNYAQSLLSYEGRDKSKWLAYKKAENIVRSIIPLEWLYGGQTITDQDINLLMNKAAFLLDGDSEVQSKLKLALKNQYQVSDRNQISAASLNLIRHEVGPIEISSARYIRIATVIRQWYLSQLNGLKFNSSFEYVSNIAIALVVFDAVLDQEFLEALIETIIHRRISQVKDTFLIHVTLSKNNSVFEKSIILSPTTSALMIGYLKLSKDPLINLKDNEQLDEEGAKQLQKILKQIISSVENNLERVPFYSKKQKLTIPAFFNIMSAWWQIKLPGCLYSIAIGEHHGPAPDLSTELALYAKQGGGVLQRYESVSQISKTLKNLSESTDYKPANAIAQIEAIFATVNKSQQAISQRTTDTKLGKKNSGTLKMRLKNQIQQKMQDAQSPLNIMMTEQKIVQLYLLYLIRLLNEGGSRKSTLAFSTIENYMVKTKKLISKFWDENLYDQDHTYFVKKYDELIKEQKQNTNLPDLLQQFHQVFQEEIDAPPCWVPGSKDKIITYTRGALLTNSQFKVAWELVDQLGIGIEEKKHVRTYLALSFGFGMRRSEAFYTEPKCFHSDNAGVLYVDVVPNAQRSLKSHASRRRVPGYLLFNEQVKHLNSIIKQLNLIDDREITDEGVAIPFQDSGRQSKINNLYRDYGFADERYPVVKLERIVTTLLRTVTGNDDVVPHSMRHSAGTKLAHFSVQSPRKISVSKTVEEELGAFNSDALFETFSKGYHAWPFWMDQAAMFLGHAGVDTLLNTYWHSSAVRMAEHTWHYSTEIESLDNQTLANMMGYTRTALIKTRSRFQEKQPQAELMSNERLIQSYVSKWDVSEPIVNHGEGEDQDIDTEFSKELQIYKQPSSTRWFTYDRLLMLRLQKNLSYDQLKEVAKQFEIQAEQYQKFWNEYVALLSEVGLTDFEPDNSNLMGIVNTNSIGLKRGTKERWKGLALVQKCYEKSPENAKDITSFCTLWERTVNPIDPWFVARNAEEISLIVKVLTSIGVITDQFEYKKTMNFDKSLYENVSLNASIESIKSFNQRFSRGLAQIKIPEFAIRVKQVSGAKIGDGRDTHRLMFVVCLINRWIQELQSEPPKVNPDKVGGQSTLIRATQ
ncbi:MAG: hypothetical protein CTY12_07675 [Methylotenera sp.]|nr:MAG: hypothetical protein CTY12_07675 [Methylotenera sp.]